MALQKPFRGLANALGLYEGGTLKLDLDRTVKLDFPIRDFALEFRYVWVNTSVSSNGFAPVATVPDGELWVVTRLSIVSTGPLGVGNTIQATGLAYDDSGTRRLCLVNPRQASAGVILASQGDLDEGFLLEPGWQVGYNFENFAGAAIPVQQSLRYAPITL